MAGIIYQSLKSFDGKVSDREFNALVDAVQAITLNPGRGYTISRNSTGTVITTTPGTAGGASPKPFDILVAPGATAGTVKVNVVPGTLNNLMPSNMFDAFPVSATGIIKVKVRGTSNGQAITSSSLIVDAADIVVQTPTPGALPLSVDVLVGIIIDGVPYRVIGPASVSLVGKLHYTADKVSPAIGERPYIPFYVWTPVS